MSYHLETLNQLRQQQPAPDDLKPWAQRVCKASRQAHIDLWTFRFSPEDARAFRELLRAVAVPISDVEECSIYRRNLYIRLASIENYLTGGPPIVPPDAVPEELVLCDETRLAQHRAEELRKQNPSKCAALALE